MMLRLLALVLLTVLMSGCVTVPKDNATVLATEERQRLLAALSAWQMTGRIGLTSSTEAVSGDITWQQAGNSFTIGLTGPLGRRLDIEQTPTGATLSASGQGTARGDRADTLLTRALGIPVPLTQLGAWLKGAVGENTTPGFDRFGRLVQLKYTDGNGVRWVARIKRYQQVDASGFRELKNSGQIDLPGLIEITGDEYSIRLLVKRWQGLSPDAAEKPSGNGRLAIPGA